MGTTLTFQDHLRELRNRVLFVGSFLLCFSVVGYLIRNILVSLINKPLGSPLYYNTPAGSFNFMIKLSLIFALFMSIPIFVYNFMAFIHPAVHEKLSKKYFVGAILTSTILAFSGALFAYIVLLPLSLHFFFGYSSANIKPLITANEYLSYVMNMLVSFALMFQIPLIVAFINRVKPMKPRQLLKYQKYVIVSAIIIAVILPFTYDPVTQFVVVIPMLLLFYLSIVLVHSATLISKKKDRAKVINPNINFANFENNLNRELDHIIEELPGFAPVPLRPASVQIQAPKPIVIQPRKNISTPRRNYVDGFRPYNSRA